MSSLMLRPGREPEVVVDLSNVCRDEDLPPVGRDATLRRFATVMNTWVAVHGRPPKGLAVADKSLTRHLANPKERELLRKMIRDGYAVEADGADGELLRIADETGAQVLSLDLFRGHRRRFPWIQGSTDRFVGWELVGGTGQLFDRDMGLASPYTISQHEERDDYMERGLRVSEPDDQRIIRRVYRCGNPRCLHTIFSEDASGVRPNRRRGKIVCSCGEPLEDIGDLPTALELVFQAKGNEFGRIAIVAGERLRLGRDLLAGLAKDGLDQAKLDRISRQHIELALDGAGKLSARDLGSTNGTQIAKWNRDQKRCGALEPIASNETVRVGRRDLLRLAGVLELRASGRRFAAPPARQATPSSPDLKKTSHV